MSRYYCYQAMTAQGVRVQGCMQAVDQQDLARLLLQQNYYLIRARLKIWGRGDWHHYFINTQQLQEFCFQVYLLLQSGIPLLEVLFKLKHQQSSRYFKAIIHQLLEQLNQGSMLSQALKSFPKLFDNTFISVVRTGEHSGELANSLKNLATYLEWKNTLRQQLGRALIYPLVLSCVMASLLSIIMIIVVPELEHFIPQNDDMPFMTISLLSTARWLQHNAGVALIIIVGMITSVLTMRGLSKTFAQRLSFIALKFPFIGSIIELIDSEKFTNTMQVLMTAGIPLLNCIEESRLTLKNLWLQQRLCDVSEHIRRGSLLSQAMERENIFKGLLSHIIATGEQSGELAQALSYGHHYVQQTLKRRLNLLVTLVEPTLILIIGLILMWIAVAIFVPLYSVCPVN